MFTDPALDQKYLSLANLVQKIKTFLSKMNNLAYQVEYEYALSDSGVHFFVLDQKKNYPKNQNIEFKTKFGI